MVLSLSTLTNLATYSNGADNTGGGVGFVVVALAVAVLLIAAMWRVFTKAGRPGWAAIVPIYNTYVVIKIAGRPGWWLVWYFVPIANLVVSLIVLYDLAKAFGKGVGYMLLLVFIPFIGWPLLAWGDAKYKKPRQKRA